MQCNFIGAGRLGKALIFALKKFKIINLISICNRKKHTANTQKNFITLSDLEQLPPSDITFITSPDDTLQTIAATLANNKILLKNSIVVHCSGVLDSSVLNPLRDIGCHVASIHPAKAFTDTPVSENLFAGVPCILEGDEPAKIWLKKAFETMGAEVILIKAQDKILYHTACVLASNYLVTLGACARQLMTESNIPEFQARNIIQKLMQGTLHNIEQMPNIEQALTGPLMRGDLNTLDLHLQHLKSFPEIKQLYRVAGLASLSLTDLSGENFIKMKALLETM